jgi:hypothetical protein
MLRRAVRKIRQSHQGGVFMNRENSGNPTERAISRRQFLVISALGMTGAVFIPFGLAEASIIASNIEQFALGIGGVELADSIDDYLAGKRRNAVRALPKAVADEVKDVNRRLKRGGFNDPNAS